MKKARFAIVGCLALVLGLASLSAEAPTINEKKDIAIFALGYYGWNIPHETLGSIDQEIQKVFVDLGRFNIIGVTQRLSSGGLDAFIAPLQKAKEANFVLQEKYQFCEATLTEAEFSKLLGAFIVAVPVVSEFNSEYDSYKNQWNTDITTHVTFIDVASGGTVIGVAEVESSGTDTSSQRTSISNAIDAIPMQLQFEIRKVGAFQLSTRVLAISGGEIKLQSGKNMGIKKGDEYSIVKTENVEGLVQIKDVDSEFSTGQVVYSGIPLTKDLQLKEIPRLGIDMEPFFHIIAGENGATIPGIRFVPSRGYYGLRPYATVQLPLGQVWSSFTVMVLPVSAGVGGEYEMHLGRLSLTPYAGAGLTYLYVSDTNFFPHVGAQAYIDTSYLLSRDMKVFAQIGVEHWQTINPLFESYGGLGFGGGVAVKL